MGLQKYAGSYRVVSALLLLLLLLVYSQGLQGNFAFDDHANIVSNEALRAGGSALENMASAATSGITSPLGRPLSMVSFALNYQVFGTAPFSFKLTNLVIHYANALLIFVLIRQLTSLLARYPNEPASCVPAAVVALVWALHPMNAMPVLHVVQRMTSLSALFMLLGLIFYVYGRRSKTLVGHVAIVTSLVVWWPAAVYSKETGLLLPVYIVLIEWLLLRSFQSIAQNTFRLSCVLAVGVLLGLCWAKWDWIVGGYRMRDFTLADRLFTEPRVLWFYIQQLLFPIPHAFGLYHDDIVVSRGWFDPPQTFFAILGWVSVVCLAFWQRTKRPLFSLAIFWFLGSHLLESTVLPLEIAHEHRNYLASVGLFWYFSCWLLPRENGQPWQLTRSTVLLGFVLFCGFTTSLRSLQWGDDFTRTQTEVFNHPQSARANYEFATLVLERTFDARRGNAQAYETVRNHFQRAADLHSDNKAALLGVLYLDCAAGRPKNIDVLSEVQMRFANAPFAPGDRGVVTSLSAMLVENKLCLEDGEVQSLINAGLANQSLDGGIRGMFYAVAMDYAAARMQSLPLALEFARAAVASDPSAITLRVNLIHLFLAAGKVDQARQELIKTQLLPLTTRDKRTLAQLESKLEATNPDANKR